MAKFIEEVVPEGLTQVRFARNTTYAGVDYGPDYDEQVAAVESRQAAIWIQRGRCVPVASEVRVETTSEPLITNEPAVAEAPAKKAKK